MVQLFVPKLSPSFQDSDSSLKIEYPWYPYEHEKQGVCPTILRPVQRFVGVQPALQLNDSDLMKEPAYAATIIQDIITGGITEPTNFHKWLNTLNVINGSYLWAANAQLSRSAARGS